MVVVLSAGLTSSALAIVESSCPTPCNNPPKSTIFVWEHGGVLDGAARMVPLNGTLAQGKANTVLHVDASLIIRADATIGSVFISVLVNGMAAGGVGSFVNGCTMGGSTYCSTTGTFTVDLDALEGANPGAFIGQPLNVVLSGGSRAGGTPGLSYEAMFSALLVKKR